MDQDIQAEQRRLGFLHDMGGFIIAGFIISLTAPPLFAFFNPKTLFGTGIIFAVAGVLMWERRVAGNRSKILSAIFLSVLLGGAVWFTFALFEAHAAADRVAPVCAQLQSSMDHRPTPNDIAMFDALKCWPQPAR